jgi:site-specific recombinase XerD
MKRLIKKSLPVRDMAGLNELQIAFDFVLKQDKYTPFTKARDIVCLFILFVTGLRVSNLLKLNASHLKQILHEHRFDIQIIKKRQNIVQTFFIPNAALSLLDQLSSYFNNLVENKHDHAPVITQQDCNKPVLRTYLNERLNSILKVVSTITHKNIKTHSFRINLTTALIEAVGIDTAAKAIGHADIRTTEMYNRRILGENQIVQAMNLAHRHLDSLYKKREQKKEYKRRRFLKNQLKLERGK